MSSTIAYLFVDVKTNKEYHLKPGKQLIGTVEEFACDYVQLPRLYFWPSIISAASSNYSGSEDVDLKLACGDDVAPFLVELSVKNEVKKQSARLTCIAGYCVAKSMGIGPGGAFKLRNGIYVQ